MTSATPEPHPQIVIAGNPNTGKSTVFNQLTGGRAKVGNYPGITVERSLGHLRLPGGQIADVYDSPGTYSLVARSPEEELSLESIAGLPPLEPADLVVVTIDASQLGRNLYLVLQIIELGIPVVVALNMIDTLEETGQEIHVETLETALGVPVVPMAARSGKGVDWLTVAIGRVIAEPQLGQPGWRWQPDNDQLLSDIDNIATHIPDEWSHDRDDQRRALALWAVLSLAGEHTLQDVPAALQNSVNEVRAVADKAGRDLEQEIIGGRYAWIDARAGEFVRERSPSMPLTDRVDKVLLHPVLGFFLFLTLMTVVFQALFTGADPLIGFIEGVVGRTGGIVGGWLGPSLQTDFVVNGVIEGVGAFLVFLPQILMLFLFIGIMEDTGYMARVAVLMDRIMKSIGLHGRAFVPLMSGYACAVPAIMATRTMERRRDRMLTMMALPLMTCSARLPVYGLLIAAMVPPWEETRFAQGLLMAAMYLFGTIMALVAAWVMGRTVFKGSYIPLVIEMPPYRMPYWPSLLHTVWRRGVNFLKTAGTIILVASMGMWVLLTFPKNTEIETRYAEQKAQIEQQIQTASDTELEELQRAAAALNVEEASVLARNSYAGRLGRAIEPVIEPLGFDWKIGIGVVAAFAAREVFVSTMGVVFGVGEDPEEDTRDLREKMWSDTWPDGRKVFTPLACLSLMVFFALACQCMSTLAVVKRETGTWKWPAVMFAYMTVLAWAASFVVFQGGLLLGFG
ncbi:MAG: ferrous iron transport protein B [Gammaproteobacteria bacterium]